MIVGGGLLLALAGLAGFLLGPRDGMVLVEGLPADAVVEVDGAVVAVNRDERNTGAFLHRRGVRQMRVTQGNDVILADEINITGDIVRVRVARATAAVAAPPETRPLAARPPALPAPPAAPVPQPVLPSSNHPAPVNRLATVAPNGRWRVEGNELVQDTLDRSTGVLFGDPGWEDYDFTAEAMRTEGNEDLSVIFRAEDWTASYWAGFGTYGNRWYEVSSAEQVVPQKRRILPAVKGSIQSNAWYEIRVKVRGAHCEVFLDGKRIFEFQDDRYRRGRVGFRSFQTAVRFRNITVTDPDGKILWAGPPELSN